MRDVWDPGFLHSCVSFFHALDFILHKITKSVRLNFRFIKGNKNETLTLMDFSILALASFVLPLYSIKNSLSM